MNNNITYLGIAALAIVSLYLLYKIRNVNNTMELSLQQMNSKVNRLNTMLQHNMSITPGQRNELDAAKIDETEQFYMTEELKNEINELEKFHEQEQQQEQQQEQEQEQEQEQQQQQEQEQEQQQQQEAEDTQIEDIKIEYSENEHVGSTEEQELTNQLIEELTDDNVDKNEDNVNDQDTETDKVVDDVVDAGEILVNQILKEENEIKENNGIGSFFNMTDTPKRGRELNTFTVKDLKQMATEMKLRTSGSKQELVQRIRSAQE